MKGDSEGMREIVREGNRERVGKNMGQERR